MSNPEAKEPSGLATMLDFVTYVKQEEGLTQYQAVLFTVSSSLLGLCETIRLRFQRKEPLNHLALVMGLMDLIEWSNKLLEESRNSGESEDLGQP